MFTQADPNAGQIRTVEVSTVKAGSVDREPLHAEMEAGTPEIHPRPYTNLTSPSSSPQGHSCGRSAGTKVLANRNGCEDGDDIQHAEKQSKSQAEST